MKTLLYNLFISVFLVSFGSPVMAQINHNFIDSTYKAKIIRVKQYLKLENDTDYIIYILAHKILVITKRNSGYHLDFMFESFDFHQQKWILVYDHHENIEESKLLDKAFSPSFYHIGVFYSNVCYGLSNTYFEVSIKGKIISKIFLPGGSCYSPKKLCEPMDKKLMTFLTHKIIGLPVD